MSEIHFSVVATDMVWQWYYDELGSKHVRELLAREASSFISDMNVTNGSGNDCHESMNKEISIDKPSSSKAG